MRTIEGEFIFQDMRFHTWNLSNVEGNYQTCEHQVFFFFIFVMAYYIASKTMDKAGHESFICYSFSLCSFEIKVI